MSAGYPVCSTTKFVKKDDNSATECLTVPCDGLMASATPFVADERISLADALENNPAPPDCWSFISTWWSLKPPCEEHVASTRKSSTCWSVGNSSKDKSARGGIEKYSPISPKSCAFLILSIPKSASRSASSSTISEGYPVCSTTNVTRKSANSLCVYVLPE